MKLYFYVFYKCIDIFLVRNYQLNIIPSYDFELTYKRGKPTRLAPKPKPKPWFNE